jgi:hypothetical protein
MVNVAVFDPVDLRPLLVGTRPSGRTVAEHIVDAT